MKKVIDIGRLLLRQMMTVLRKVSSPFDDVNVALHESRALHHFQVSCEDSGEFIKPAGIEVSERRNGNAVHDIDLVVVTKTDPTLSAQHAVNRSLNAINRRFGTHLSARVVRR